MARPIGSFSIKCEECDKNIVAKTGEQGVCKNCGHKVRFTKKLLRSLGKDV